MKIAEHGIPMRESTHRSREDSDGSLSPSLPQSRFCATSIEKERATSTLTPLHHSTYGSLGLRPLLPWQHTGYT